MQPPFHLVILRLSSGPYGHYKAQGHHIGYDRRTSVTQERKRDTGNRHQSHRHRNILKNLKYEHTDKSDNDQRAVQIDCVQTDPHKTDQQNRKQSDDDQTTDQA